MPVQRSPPRPIVVPKGRGDGTVRAQQYDAPRTRREFDVDLPPQALLAVRPRVVVPRVEQARTNDHAAASRVEDAVHLLPPRRCRPRCRGGGDQVVSVDLDVRRHADVVHRRITVLPVQVAHQRDGIPRRGQHPRVVVGPSPPRGGGVRRPLAGGVSGVRSRSVQRERLPPRPPSDR